MGDREQQLEAALWQCHTLSKGKTMAQTCAVHDEVIDRLKERDSRLESKIDTVAGKVGKIESEVSKLGLTIAKWSGALAVVVAGITLAAKYLLP